MTDHVACRESVGDRDPRYRVRCQVDGWEGPWELTESRAYSAFASHVRKFEPDPPRPEVTIYDLLRALVVNASTQPGFVQQYMTPEGQTKWFEVIEKAERLNTFGETARHLGEQ